MRIQKYLSAAGFCSRRKAEELVIQGKVQINGKSANIGDSLKEGKDRVLVEGKSVSFKEKPLYILLYKPKGYITSNRDPEGRKTVLDLLGDVKGRVFPVGRLDYDTEGLILLTNDGELTNKLTHPKHQIEKVYKVRCQGILTRMELAQLGSGVVIDEDYLTGKANLYAMEKKGEFSIVEIGIMEGKNRQIRKMFEALGHPVLALKRIRIGFLKIDKLKRGEHRFLTKNEIEKLKKLTN